MDINRKRRHADYMFAKRNVEKSNQTYKLNSHVIAHETNHAIRDRLRYRLRECHVSELVGQLLVRQIE